MSAKDCLSKMYQTSLIHFAGIKLTPIGNHNWEVDDVNLAHGLKKYEEDANNVTGRLSLIPPLQTTPHAPRPYVRTGTAPSTSNLSTSHARRMDDSMLLTTLFPSYPDDSLATPCRKRGLPPDSSINVYHGSLGVWWHGLLDSYYPPHQGTHNI